MDWSEADSRALRTALGELKAPFANFVLKDQDCLSRPGQWDTVLNILPDKGALLHTYMSELFRILMRDSVH